MSRIRWYGPTMVLVFAVLLVMIAGPGLARRVAHAHRDQRLQLVRQNLALNPTLAELSNAFRQVAQAVEPSVVHIEVVSRQARGRHRRLAGGMSRPRVFGNGSGWVFDDQGHIVTCEHVIKNAETIYVRFSDGSQRRAYVVGADPKTDIAVIRVDSDVLHAAEPAIEQAEQGDMVFAFGSPFGKEFSMSQGVVSATGREVGMFMRRDGSGRIFNDGFENFIQTDAAINPGNSGGPLTNIYGRVIAMNSAIASNTNYSNGVGFAIPIDMIMPVVEQLIANGEVRRGYMGVLIVEAVDKNEAESLGVTGGVMVNPIADGPAATAGIQPGDIITHINDQPIHDVEQLRLVVSQNQPGTELTIAVVRDGRRLELVLFLVAMDEVEALPGWSAPEREPDVDTAEQPAEVE